MRQWPGSKIPSTTCVSCGQRFAKRTTTPDEIFYSTAADRGTDTKQKYNNQPNNRFNVHLGRVSLQCWVDWAAVARLAAHLVRGPFLRLSTQVDCHELHFSPKNSPMKLQVSHVIGNSVGQHRLSLQLTAQLVASRSGVAMVSFVSTEKMDEIRSVRRPFIASEASEIPNVTKWLT